MGLCLGLDFGTSGVRGIVIEDDRPVGRAEAPLPPSHVVDNQVTQKPADWWDALDAVMQALGPDLLGHVAALSVDGTAGTLLLADESGQPLTPARMYNDSAARDAAARIAALAPDSPAATPTSSLARLLDLAAETPDTRHALHQTDWILGRLSGRYGITDAHHALKLGWDPLAGTWPEWLEALPEARPLLPEVVEPGTLLGTVDAMLAERWGLPETARVFVGTTDSTAAVIATGAHRPGDAVTVLGSTLVMKLLSPEPLFAPELGVYSHRLGDVWLAGGASNAGGAVLQAFFTDAEMEALTPRLHPSRGVCLDYYPLRAPGERFPIPDPDLSPRLTPRPKDDARFFQGLLEGLARIERLGYRRLTELGAPRPKRVISLGGGARNPAWLAIRERIVGIPVERAAHNDAAFGTARLACRALVALEEAAA